MKWTLEVKPWKIQMPYTQFCTKESTLPKLRCTKECKSASENKPLEMKIRRIRSLRSLVTHEYGWGASVHPPARTFHSPATRTFSRAGESRMAHCQPAPRPLSRARTSPVLAGLSILPQLQHANEGLALTAHVTQSQIEDETELWASLQLWAIDLNHCKHKKFQ